MSGPSRSIAGRKKQAAVREASKAKAEAKTKNVATTSVAPKFQPKADKAKRTPWKLEALEKKIFSLEELLEQLTEEMADPELYTRPDEQKRLSDKYLATKAECEELTALWEEMA